VVRGAGDAGEGAFAQTESVKELGALVGRELGRLGLELHTHAEHVGRVAELGDQGLDHVLRVSHLVLTEVDQGEHRLVRQEEGRAQVGPGLGVEVGAVDGRARLQHREGGLQGIHLGAQRRVVLRRLAPLADLGLNGGCVGQHELELEHLQIVERVAAADHVLVLEGAQDEAQGVGLADAGEKPVAHALPRRGPGDQAGDVDELDRGVHDLLAVAHGGQRLDTRVGHAGQAHVGLRRREGMRCDGRRTARQRIEQSRLPGVRQADDAEPLHNLRGYRPCRRRPPSARTRPAATRPTTARSPTRAARPVVSRK
jgi:hypothetical protein